MGKSKFAGMDVDIADERLSVLNAMNDLNDISPLASVGSHKLRGNRSGQWAITINGPWRICFEFKNGDVFNVEITDYH
ncbi:MAG: type II toxin-antitoxin system RelE/ParE family toxin [Gammaproteobacteria bacterium]|nr:type II toxin-antitoxin system RelE/ParE family toxin [Gammaproteobacteria bacterium]